MENKMVTDAERDQIFSDLKKQFPDNDKCFDCGKRNPKWASVSLGLFLCIDCSGKHREYTVRYTFVRSLTLDSWSIKQIAQMQLGGNAQARQYFEEVGLLSNTNKAMDYKTAHVEKYKALQTKRVEDYLAQQQQLPNASPVKEEVQAPMPVFQEEEPKEKFQCNLEGEVAPKVIQPKSKIVFQSNKPIEGSVKGKNVQGKKITNVDFDALMFDDPFSTANTSQPVSSDPFGVQQMPSTKSQVEEPKVIIKETKFNTVTPATQVDQQTKEQLDKFKEKNVKSISSSSLFQQEDSEQNRQNIQKFSGQQAISSKQFFGEPEDANQSDDSSQKLENVKQFFSFAGEKAKDTIGNLSTQAGGYWSSLRQKFGGQS